MFALARRSTLARYPCIRTYATSPSPRRSGTGALAFLGIFGAATSLYFFLPDASRGAPTSKDKPLSPSHFTPTTVVSSEPSGPNSKLITLKVSPHALPPAGTTSPIWSVFIKDDDIQVERPYTPLESVDEYGQMVFWIKKYPSGEVGRWLHSKNVGDQVELRGPLQTWAWKDGVWDEVVMISGGTGITPFYQLFHSQILRGAEDSKTRFTLLHASRTLSDLPPPRILSPLASYAKENPERFQFHLFVDSKGASNSATNSDAIPTPRTGRIDKTALQQSLGTDQTSTSWWNVFGSSKKENVPRKVLFLVCGPESMISAIAGPYGRNFSQGPVGGVLGDLGYTSDVVYKL